MASITAIVNIYKRPHILDEQIAAIKCQTIPPQQIFIWNNGNKEVDLSKYVNDPLFCVFNNNFNSGVWTRFLIALLAKTEFVCIFDDDTIPGHRWFENCVNSMKEREALYGTIGVLFRDTNKYLHLKRYGWDGPSETSKYVDIVGHSWFFKQVWIREYFLKEEPQIYTKISNGEDMHFSFMLQKYANISTIVPPHPRHDMSLWGSTPKTAWGYGCDGRSETISHYPIDSMFKENIDRGFRIMIQRNGVTLKDDFDYFIKKIEKHEPFALLRPADGEYHVLKNQTLTNIDYWTFSAGDRLCDDLNKSIKEAVKQNAYIGIGCVDCNKDLYDWYLNTFQLNPLFTTFANVFVNSNWKHWVEFLKQAKLEIHLFGPSNNPCFLNVASYHHIPEKLVNSWNRDAEATLSSVLEVTNKSHGKIFFFSCGPIAKILISRAWAENKTNTYIDIGSSLDVFFKGYSNRFYIDGDLKDSTCKFHGFDL
jgi:hypothetical protein